MVKVERVENLELWRRYSTEAAILAKQEHAVLAPSVATRHDDLAKKVPKRIEDKRHGERERREKWELELNWN